MNAYRVVLIMCRAITIALWWRAGFGLAVDVSMNFAVGQGWFGTGFPPAASSLLVSLGLSGFSVAVAVFLAIFAPSLGAAAVGSAPLEGESLSSRRALEPAERAMAVTGAGLILLFSMGVSVLPNLAWGFYELFVSRTFVTASIGRNIMIYNLIGNLVPSALYCALGLVLAFRLGLRRVIKPETQGETT